MDATLLTRETLCGRVSLRLTFAHLSTGSSGIDMPIKPHLGAENVSTPRGMLILVSPGRTPETHDGYLLISNHIGSILSRKNLQHIFFSKILFKRIQITDIIIKNKHLGISRYFYIKEVYILRIKKKVKPTKISDKQQIYLHVPSIMFPIFRKPPPYK